MARLNVKPTRMEFIILKRRIKTAQRGHKLLRDKQDGLMQQFMAIIRETRELRADVEKKLGSAFRAFLFASASMYPQMLEGALTAPETIMTLGAKLKNVMSVRIPEFELHHEGNIMAYGFAQTSNELDVALKTFQEIFPLLVKLAQMEKQAERLAEEIEKTRRRVNALEHKMIPDLIETAKFIRMKLSEAERSAVVSVMLIKAQIAD